MNNSYDEILGLWSELFIARPLAIKKVEEKMKERNPLLSLEEYDLLLIISREKNQKCRLNVISEKTLYTKSGVTRVVNRMLEKGYIKKDTCEEDKRGQYASLTPLGIKALKQTWNIYSKAIIQTLEPCMLKDDVIQLRRLLTRLIEELRSDNIVSMPTKK